MTDKVLGRIFSWPFFHLFSVFILGFVAGAVAELGWELLGRRYILNIYSFAILFFIAVGAIGIIFKKRLDLKTPIRWFLAMVLSLYYYTTVGTLVGFVFRSEQLPGTGHLPSLPDSLISIPWILAFGTVVTGIVFTRGFKRFFIGEKPTEEDRTGPFRWKYFLIGLLDIIPVPAFALLAEVMNFYLGWEQEGLYVSLTAMGIAISLIPPSYIHWLDRVFGVGEKAGSKKFV